MITKAGKTRGSRTALLVINPVNERIITLHIQGRLGNITLIQVFSPTLVSDEEQTEGFYAENTMTSCHYMLLVSCLDSML